MVMIVPIYEVEMTGVFYNTAAVFDADGKYLGKYRKHHIPHCHPGFWEKFYFTPGNAGYPVFQTRYGAVGVYICYDRHFPEGARILGLNGAEIVFNPSATVAGLSEYLVGTGTASACRGEPVFRRGYQSRREPRSRGASANFTERATSAIRAERSSRRPAGTRTELLVANLNLDEIEQVRATWQFYRDRRPESYGEIVKTRSPGAAKAAD